MWFFETGVTHLLDKKYQNKYWVGITETWYTLFYLAIKDYSSVFAILGAPHWDTRILLWE